MTRDSHSILDVWAHLANQRDQVLARARQEAAGAGVPIKGEGPVRMVRGSTLVVRVRIAGLPTSPAHRPLLWEGEIGNAGFRVTVPADAATGAHAGAATVLMGGAPIARVFFEIEVGERADGMPQLQGRGQHYRKAFASYASEDRDGVLGRIQGLQKGLPGLKIVLDLMSLRSGERWQTRLEEEIVSSDVFYLFWSRAASQSKWVDWEWRCALKERGIDFIDPCPLVSPEQVPPPAELATLHFNDCWLACTTDTSASDGQMAKL